MNLFIFILKQLLYSFYKYQDLWLLLVGRHSKKECEYNFTKKYLKGECAAISFYTISKSWNVISDVGNAKVLLIGYRRV